MAVCFVLSGHSGSVEKIFVDKSMVGKLSGEIVSEGKCTVETVICDPSRDLNEKVAYDRGSLNTVSIQ